MKDLSNALIAGILLLVAGLLAGPSTKGLFPHQRSMTGSSATEQLKCPVCGMFVAGYAAWRAAIHFDDGYLVAFDGVKDLFKYYFDVQHYDSERTTNHIKSIQVTDYHSLNTIDGYRSRYVMGSDVLGPMGHELIPFATELAAREFLQDHHGEQVLTFEEVNKEMISGLERQGPNVLRRQGGAARGGGL